MVRLTEEMVVARSRISDLTAVKKLNCWGSELTDVSILRDLKKVEVLSLSVNNINTLADFQFCMNLKDLFVRKNNITDLNEVCYLQNLPNLRNLWLGENPCAERDGYRMAVIRALPNLEKLDDKFVTSEELNVALSRGKILVHPLDMDASPAHSAPPSPQEVAEYIDEPEPEANRRYSSSSDQRSYEETQGHDEYQENDRRNANYNASPANTQYSQNNHYNYEDYDERPAVPRHNGDYEDHRRYDYSLPQEPSPRTSQGPTSPRSSYPTVEYVDERRSSSYDYDEEPQQAQPVRRQYQERSDDPREVQGWVRHSEKDKCRFHYHRRPVTRNSNILSAVLCLVKELDYPSLEVVEMAVRNRMDELEE